MCCNYGRIGRNHFPLNSHLKNGFDYKFHTSIKPHFSPHRIPINAKTTKAKPKPVPTGDATELSLFSANSPVPSM